MQGDGWHRTSQNIRDPLESTVAREKRKLEQVMDPRILAARLGGEPIPFFHHQLVNLTLQTY